VFGKWRRKLKKTLEIHKYGRKYGRMKTTIEIDEEKLEAIMRLTALGTRKEAVDWALTEALRIAEINRIAENPWDANFLKDAVDPDYDVIALRRESSAYPPARRGRKR
jgi:Arc/MetJ family transcription regulator